MAKLGHTTPMGASRRTRSLVTRNRRSSRWRVRGLEALEARELLAIMSVTNLDPSGPGSLRQAIICANSMPGPDTIDFGVSGTINVGRAPLPAITDTVFIDGTSAPSYHGAPVVTVNFQGTRGFTFAGGSDGSGLKSLSLVRAGGAGVTLSAPDITVVGNYIGLLADGSTLAGNRGDGIRINASSQRDFIGPSNPDLLMVQTGFQLSNVISGNGGNGIAMYGAGDSHVLMNYIGTDATGTLRRPNGRNGILLTNGAFKNLIGGEATGGNNPTGDKGTTTPVLVVPPEGNLVSANRGNGILITRGATNNQLSGNFIGTAAKGDSALGNRGDGVAIVGANGNQLIGCRLRQEPFVFYNVISGNARNGLRITNSNDTTVQANFMGVGANNSSIVANGGDGLLVSGTSTNTQVGGVIPLGNVIAGNDQNGIEVRDRVSGFISFNTFDGLYAFQGAAPNRRNGILITATGGNNTIRTCIVSGNLGNGIVIGGNASGVQVTDTAVGTNTDINAKLPNNGNGIVINGNAHGNAIGGFQPSIEPQATVSGNLHSGIVFAGRAHNNFVVHTYVGTDFLGVRQIPNLGDGIDIGPGTRANTIGGTAAAFLDKIRFNGGAGVAIARSTGDVVQGSEIDGNVGSGVSLTQSQRVTIGGAHTGDGNSIIANQNYGVYAVGACFGSVIQANEIRANTPGNVNLTKARGVTYIP